MATRLWMTYTWRRVLTKGEKNVVVETYRLFLLNQ